MFFHQSAWASRIHELVSNGTFEQIHEFLTYDIHWLPREELCAHVDGSGNLKVCNNVPCRIVVDDMIETAATPEKVDLFTMLWDTFAPWKTGIANGVLDGNARVPSIPLAEALRVRIPDCFNYAVDFRQHTQLTRAVLCNNYEYADYMLDHGADINQQLLYTAMGAVASNGEEETRILRTRFLIERGARVRGSGSMYSAASGGKLNLIRYLLSQGAEVDEKHIYRRETALMAAAKQGHAHVVKFLLQQGADITTTNSYRETALELAEKYGRKEVVDLIRQHMSLAM